MKSFDVRRCALPWLACLLPIVLAAGCSKSPDPAAPTAASATVPVAESIGAAASAIVTPEAAAAIGAAAAGATSEGPGIAWRQPAGEAGMEALLAESRSSAKPLFLYWGAVWCPPCNHVKATVFKQAEFIEKSRGFIPVYLDGDSPGAQKLGERFKVRGYPTMILLRPDGGELTRLPGEVDARKYLQVLSLGLQSARPLREVLADALDAPARLAAADWRLLAYYSWDTDEQSLVPKAQVARTLERLADACPPAQTEAHTRLALKAMSAKADAGAGDAKTRRAAPPAAREQMLAVLGTEALLRDNLDIVTNQARDLTAWLTAPDSDERRSLAAQWAATLDRLTADAARSQGDRASALIGRVQLARLEAGAGPKGPVTLNDVMLEHVRREAARFDAQVQGADERQAVIPAAAYALAQAGLFDDADRLLKRELDRSHSPYYAMLSLASNARQRGDKSAALDWHQRAYETSKGMATRVQWGSGYVQALVDLAPQDTQRIEQAALAVLGEVEGQPDAFYERTARYLERMSDKLVAWPRGAGERTVLERLRTRRTVLCDALPDADPQRRACEALLAPAATRKKGSASA